MKRRQRVNINQTKDHKNVRHYKHANSAPRPSTMCQNCHKIGHHHTQCWHTQKVYRTVQVQRKTGWRIPATAKQEVRTKAIWIPKSLLTSLKT